jgi:circadian clock protein KaiB
MSLPSGEARPSWADNAEIPLLRLYIAAETPNSIRAIANLKIICREFFGDRCQVEVVDILKEPLRALSEGVLVTPTLVKLSPPPVQKIIGDLSEMLTVAQALGVEGRDEETQRRLGHQGKHANGADTATHG